ncbi:hypothetical protein [Tepidibacter hydrothermalis]|uniref:Lipoprotein n=1 Tax=Tepidibacter hydrothermalis TaxID=3036126 RepID=A0ABY8EAC0_9FIRM|nr:hypothetical protein [Tepidibacter hydrothermalis]WFD09849.1 hypothetical protein P4S50_15835 [Tepidibacter hydrothermalis]
MKKHSFLITFILLSLFTFLSYSYQRENYEDVIKPYINIESESLGTIRNIEFYSISNHPSLIILSTKNEQGIDYSYLNLLDINTNKITQIDKYKSHKYLNNFVTRDHFSSYNIITACNYGIVNTEVEYDDDGLLKFNPEKQDIFKFENADSMDFKNGALFFSSKGDDLIYKQILHNDFFASFTNNNTPNQQTFYKKPLYIVNSNSLDGCLSYTKVNKDRLDLYRMYYGGESIDIFNKPLIKNIVHARELYNSYGFIGMNINSDSKLNIFMIRNQSEDQDNYKIDTIDYNTDMFGSVPSIDSLTFNEDYTLVYTSYDKNNKGKITSIGYTLHKYQQHPKTILEDENLYGPVRIQKYKVNDKYVKNIMYFTYEDGLTKVNFCDMDGNKIKSISL